MMILRSKTDRCICCVLTNLFILSSLSEHVRTLCDKGPVLDTQETSVTKAEKIRATCWLASTKPFLHEDA